MRSSCALTLARGHTHRCVAPRVLRGPARQSRTARGRADYRSARPPRGRADYRSARPPRGRADYRSARPPRDGRTTAAPDRPGTGGLPQRRTARGRADYRSARPPGDGRTTAAPDRPGDGRTTAAGAGRAAPDRPGREDQCGGPVRANGRREGDRGDCILPVGGSGLKKKIQLTTRKGAVDPLRQGNRMVGPPTQ
jgi:hypothetical protein